MLVHHEVPPGMRGILRVAQVEPESLHEGEPTTQAEKTAMNIWVADRPFTKELVEEGRNRKLRLAQEPSERIVAAGFCVGRGRRRLVWWICRATDVANACGLAAAWPRHLRAVRADVRLGPRYGAMAVRAGQGEEQKHGQETSVLALSARPSRCPPPVTVNWNFDKYTNPERMNLIPNCLL